MSPIKGERFQDYLVPQQTVDMEFADGLDQLRGIALNEALTQTAQEKPLDKAKLKRLLEKKQQREAQKAT